MWLSCDLQGMVLSVTEALTALGIAVLLTEHTYVPSSLEATLWIINVYRLLSNLKSYLLLSSRRAPPLYQRRESCRVGVGVLRTVQFNRVVSPSIAVTTGVVALIKGMAKQRI